ncbi:hypothetical protein [Shimia sp.]|uniref:hypothetical protein n=1 Tax=Shimia sp. TaxID=1954381 RepID=UPI003B8D51FD
MDISKQLAMFQRLVSGIVIAWIIALPRLRGSFDMMPTLDRVFRLPFRFEFLAVGSVATCWASAAIAVAAISSQFSKSGAPVFFAVVGSILSWTVATTTHASLSLVRGFSNQLAGIYLRTADFDENQVGGAGLSLSPADVDTAASGHCARCDSASVLPIDKTSTF